MAAKNYEYISKAALQLEWPSDHLQVLPVSRRDIRNVRGRVSLSPFNLLGIQRWW